MMKRISLSLLLTLSLTNCGPEIQAEPTAEGPTVATHRDALMNCATMTNGGGSVGSVTLPANGAFTIDAIVASGNTLTVYAENGSTPFSTVLTFGTGFVLSGSYGTQGVRSIVTSVIPTNGGTTLTINGTQGSTPITGAINIAGGFVTSGASFAQLTGIAINGSVLSLTGLDAAASHTSNLQIYSTCDVAAEVNGGTGPIELIATAAGATLVRFFVDGALVGTATTEPFQVIYDSAALINGSHSLYAEGSDGTSRSRSPVVNFTTSNPDPGPTVTAAESGTAGTVTFSATVSSLYPVLNVKFYVDGALVGTDTTFPYSMTYNSNLLSDGSHTLVATATDNQTVTGTSPSVEFSIVNDVTGPTGVTATATGTIGTITLSGTGTDPSGIQKIEFYIAGTLVGTDTSSPYSIAYNSRLLGNGSHSLVARAYDNRGNFTNSAAVTFTTANDFTSPTSSCWLTGNRDTIYWTVTANDASGIASVTVSINPAGSGPNYSVSAATPMALNYLYFDSRQIPNSVDGHSYFCIVTDIWGNASASGITFGTNNDFSPPSLSVAVAVSGTTSRTFTATTSDPAGIQKVTFSLDGATAVVDTAAPYARTINTSGLSAGNHAMAVRSYDNYGQARLVTKTFTVP